jgi:glutamate/tyrosine decarboxylase-like PLP-dependent enzyme
MKNTILQEKMYCEMQKQSIFEKSQEYGMHYLDTVFDRNVSPTNKALENLKCFDETMPETTSNSSDILNMLHKYGSPATVAQLGGRYFGFVNGSAIPVGLAAKNLATYWDQCPAMHVLSPIASKLEAIVEKWLIELFGFPKRTVAGFVSGTSTANFCALAAARYRILKRQDWDINEKGLFNAPKIRVVASKQAHSTILKAISLLGFGKDAIEWVAVDDQGRPIAELIPELDDKTIVILQAGNVNTGAFDAFDSICKKANKANAWVHIDGAFGLWAGAVTALKHQTKGMEKANSWAVDGHKTLNTPYDSGIVLCEDKEALVSALHMSGSYLVVDDRDGMFYTPEMSRRARIIELWAVIKYLGKSGIDEMIYGMHLRTKQFENEFKAAGFEIMNDVVFNQVMIKCETDELTQKTLAKVQASKECWAGGSVWNSKKVIRISVCSWATTSKDVTRSVAAFVKARSEIK